MQPMIIGYARITDGMYMEQDPLRVLAAAGCDKVLHDVTMATPTAELPQREKAIKAAAGGTLVIFRIEQLGVSLIDVMRFLVRLRNENIQLKILDPELDSAVPVSIYAAADLVLTCNSLLQSEAVGYGMAQAKKNGSVLGRKNALSSKDKEAALALLAESGDVEAVAEQFNIRPRTLYRYRQEATDD